MPGKKKAQGSQAIRGGRQKRRNCGETAGKCTVCTFFDVQAEDAVPLGVVRIFYNLCLVLDASPQHLGVGIAPPHDAIHFWQMLYPYERHFKAARARCSLLSFQGGEGARNLGNLDPHLMRFQVHDSEIRVGKGSESKDGQFCALERERSV
jgi:hypothetical protein